MNVFIMPAGRVQTQHSLLSEIKINVAFKTYLNTVFYKAIGQL
jgi:hypothetical protein